MRVMARVKLTNQARKAIQTVFDRLEENQTWRNSFRLTMVLTAVVTTTLMFPSSQTFQFSNLNDGDVYSGKEIIAPFTFFINKSEGEIDRDRQKASRVIPLVFTDADSIEGLTLKEFDDFFDSIRLIRESIFPDSLKLRRIQDILNNDSIIIDKANARHLAYEVQMEKSRTTAAGTERSESAFDFDLFAQKQRRILVDMYAIGIVNLREDQIPDYGQKFSIISSDREVLEPRENFYNLSNYEGVILGKLRQVFLAQKIAVKIGYPILTAFQSPNLFFDKIETDRRISGAVAAVPLSKGIVLENERIVNTHEVITPAILEKLNSLAAAKAEREVQVGGIRLILPYIGRVLIVSLALSFTLLFLSIARREIFENLKKMLMIFIIFMFVVVITFTLNKLGYSTNLKYLIPISIASMLLTIFFDVRTAFIGTVSLSIIIGALRGNDFGMMVIPLFVGTLSTFAVREIQARSWILKGFFYISGAYIFAISTIEFLKHTEFHELWEMWAFGIVNGLLSPILAYGLMIIFEYVFQMTTNSTLLELSDLNKPLLRQLAIRAPGTYHHSIMVGNLCEAASETIGANALLARVASYYHDIGKMEKAEYFVENQKGGKNPHEKLTPSMSCLILINHVKRGIETAEEHHLPEEIRQFIPQHHGTNIIRFFYQKALENSEDSEVDEASFRYHGPKPQSKEAAIMMLADAIEAGSRTLKDPTVSRIRSMVDNLIQERLLDSELDESPLTMRELKKVRESFVNTLTGMFHGRVEYPQTEKRTPKRTPKKAVDA